MEALYLKNLGQIESALSVLDEKAVVDGVARHFIEILDGGPEIIVGGNAEGLLRLALELVRLASKPVGAHTHVDEESIADIAEKRLVLRVSRVRW